MADSTSPAKATLPKSVFAVEVPNHELLKLAYDSYLANARKASATTKTRGEVSGGGKKPWKQKGTGRARFGSTRNPIWRKGGIVFGPRGNENYKLAVSKTAKRTAIKQALSLANSDKKIVIDSVETTGKTSEIAKYLETKKYQRNTLIVTDKTPELIRATANIQTVKLVSPMYLNVYDVMNADHIIISPESIVVIQKWLEAPAAKDGGGKA